MSALTPKMQKMAYYLGQGLKPAQVASICNVTPGYISQLLGADGPQAFKDAVAEEQAKAADVYNEEEDLNLRYLAVEAKALKGIEDNMAGATLVEQVKVLEALNKRDLIRKQLKAPAAGSGLTGPGTSVYQMNVISLSMPQHLINSFQPPQIELNSQNQVVSIEGKSMAPMASLQVKNLFQQLSNGTMNITAEEKEVLPEPNHSIAEGDQMNDF